MHHLTENPTPVQILVSEYPNYLQYTDAFLLGEGVGVITPVIQSIQPWVCQYAWPQEIQNELLSHTNPKGRLMINDLELVVLVLGWMVLEYVV